MKYALALLLMLGCGVAKAEKYEAQMSSSTYRKEIKIDWVGHPMISDNDEYAPSMGWIPTIEIGLREDGVVVWRIKKQK